MTCSCCGHLLHLVQNFQKKKENDPPRFRYYYRHSIRILVFCVADFSYGVYDFSYMRNIPERANISLTENAQRILHQEII